MQRFDFCHNFLSDGDGLNLWQSAPYQVCVGGSHRKVSCCLCRGSVKGDYVTTLFFMF